jgi:hypothetical protein
MHGKSNGLELISIKRRFTLAKSIEIELWLSEMAHNGYHLHHITSGKYYFRRGLPKNRRYFLMSPESGSKSDSWLFIEFQLSCGIGIPCDGTSFFSPRLALEVKQNVTDKNPALIRYYYQYRNYLLLRRMRRSAIASIIFALFALLLCIFDFPSSLLVLFPYLVGSIFLCSFSTASFIRFKKSCIDAGYKFPEKKPQHPQEGTVCVNPLKK